MPYPNSLPLPRDKGYQLVSFIRIGPEDSEPLTYEEALAEKEQQELMCPENLYQIEEVC